MRINKSYYKDLSSRITEEECNSMLQKLKTSIALGLSGIRYILIKQASTKTQVAFRNFASRCLKTGRILLK